MYFPLEVGNQKHIKTGVDFEKHLKFVKILNANFLHPNIIPQQEIRERGGRRH